MLSKIKLHKSKIKHISTGSHLRLAFGSIGLRSLQNGILTVEQLSTIKSLLTKAVKKQGYFWMRVVAKTPVTSKTLGTRMGKGKGFVESFVCKIKVGCIICEISGISEKRAKSILNAAASKLSVSSSLIINSLC